VRGHRGRDGMVVGYNYKCTFVPMQSVSIATRTEFESCSDEMYTIQHYMIKFISDIRQVGGFLSGKWY
jgi:hypothetical protein